VRRERKFSRGIDDAVVISTDICETHFNVEPPIEKFVSYMANIRFDI
jgi:hypothetical protein